jgi:hypothetical protein
VKSALFVLPLLLAGCGVQPTEVITGTHSTGAMIYMVQNNTLVPTLRASRNELRPVEVLALLADGPTAAERDKGFTSEVPSAAGPITGDGATITVQVDLGQLSDIAMDQIVCTAALPVPAILLGAGQTRAQRECPV